MNKKETQRLHIGPSKDMGSARVGKYERHSVNSPSNHPTMRKPPMGTPNLNRGRSDKNPYGC